MSGHSKWASIKHKKGANDAKRGKLFSKLIKEVTIAAKIGGDNSESNSRLKMAVAKAKDANMPIKNIESAIKRGSGNAEGTDYQELMYEGYGIDGVAIIIECLTDNKNRTVSGVRSVLSKNGGSLGESGSVSWQFEKKGIVNVERNVDVSEDKLMELALEAGAIDMDSETEGFTIKCDPVDLLTVVESLKNHQVEIANSEVTMVPKNTVALSKEKAEKIQLLIEKIDDLDDVQSVSSNEVVEIQ